MSVAQVVVTGVVYFVLYRFLLRVVGVEALGVWSVVLATTSVGRLSNLGLNTSVVKFVAQDLARGDAPRAVATLETATLAIGGALAVLVLALHPLAVWALGAVIEAVHLDEAVALLPWALVSLWVSLVASVAQSGLDGIQRIDLRSILVVVTTLLYLGLCLLLVPEYGVQGLAYAQVAQSLALLVGNAALLRRLLPGMSLVPRRFDRRIFNDLLGYGLHVQAMTVGSLLLEPLAKGLVARFGGSAAAGYFEMANRMVTQLRQLLNGAAQAIVPAVAEQQVTDAAGVVPLYLRTYRTLFFVIFPALAATIAATPLISELWVGVYQPTFVAQSYVLAAGLYLGMLSSPAFFTNLGTGRLRDNTVATVAMLAVTGLPALVTGGAIGGFGVAVSYAAAYVIGGVIILVGFHRASGLGASAAVPRESVPALLGSVAATVAGLVLHYALRPRWSLAPVALTSAGAFCLVIAVPLWRHPLRHALTARLRRR